MISELFFRFTCFPVLGRLTGRAMEEPRRSVSADRKVPVCIAVSVENKYPACLFSASLMGCRLFSWLRLLTVEMKTL